MGHTRLTTWRAFVLITLPSRRLTARGRPHAASSFRRLTSSSRSRGEDRANLSRSKRARRRRRRRCDAVPSLDAVSVGEEALLQASRSCHSRAHVFPFGIRQLRNGIFAIFAPKNQSRSIRTSYELSRFTRCSREATCLGKFHYEHAFA